MPVLVCPSMCSSESSRLLTDASFCCGFSESDFSVFERVGTNPWSPHWPFHSIYMREWGYWYGAQTAEWEGGWIESLHMCREHQNKRQHPAKIKDTKFSLLMIFKTWLHPLMRCRVYQTVYTQRCPSLWCSPTTQSKIKKFSGGSWLVRCIDHVTLRDTISN